MSGIDEQTTKPEAPAQVAEAPIQSSEVTSKTEGEVTTVTSGAADDNGSGDAPKRAHDDDASPSKRVKVEDGPTFDRRSRSGRGGSRNGNDRSLGNHDRRGTRADEAATGAVGKDGDDAAGSGEARLPKRKVAVKFGYCGIGYSGLQINPGVKTIEGDVFDAFCQAGAVSKDNAVNPNKVGLQRAARTDRGVHAAGNLLSLKLILEPPTLPEGKTLVEHVNDLLPPIIRIWGVTRVQNAFNARTSCDSRMYEYLLPTYVFLPPKPGTAMWEMLKKMNDEEKAKTGADAPSLKEVLDHPFWQAQGTKHDFTADVKAKKEWRMPATQVDHVRSLMAKYTGSHNFHNFTIGKEFRDRAAQRFMKALTVSDPKMVNDTEWISIKFHGQSFMYHQIRKMIGLIVLVGRTNTPSALIPETFGPARIHIPKAPGLGLLLEEPLFGAYNSRVDISNRKLDNLVSTNAKKGVTTQHNPEDEKRDHVEFDSHKVEMEAFKQKFVYDRIMVTEEETLEFAKWLNYLDVFQGPDFEFLNPKGVIPSSAILKVGELRRAPGGQLKGSFGGGTLEKGDKTAAEESGADATKDSGDEDDDERAFLSSKDQAEYEG